MNIILFTQPGWTRKDASGADQTHFRQATDLTPAGDSQSHPQDVTHPRFQASAFFDPDDLLQVKYEMLREVRMEQRPVAQTAREFGLSRPSFYQAQ
jgi:hypothetical protein